MPISDPVSATHILTTLLVLACAASVRMRTSAGLSIEAVQELKGFAILAIVFSHIGYFLVADHRFLFPLSTIAGVGVDLFLLVSGFGLAMSALKGTRSPLDFYKRRLDKLLLPLWLALAALFSADYLVLGKSYGIAYMIHSFLGWFPSADIFHDLDSPLWYLTLILFYYLVFPLLFSPRRPALSVALILVAGYLAHHLTLPLLSGVAHLHELHLWAFPLGIALAGIIRSARIPNMAVWQRTGTLMVLVFAACYLALHQNIGSGIAIEQATSVVTALLILAIFSLKPFEVKLLSLFGLYSYEIYLFHWPIMYRYDFLFAHVPAWLSVVLYLALFVAIGWGMQWLLRDRIAHTVHTR